MNNVNNDKQVTNEAVDQIKFSRLAVSLHRYTSDAGNMYLASIILLIVGNFVSLLFPQQFSMFITYGFVLMALICFSAVYDGLKTSGFKFANIKDLICSIIMAVPIFIVITALSSAIQMAMPDMMQSDMNVLFDLCNKYNIWFLIIPYAVLPAFVEEFEYRGLLLNAFSFKSVVSGIVATSICFAVSHMSLTNLIQPLAFGLILAFVRIVTKSLWCTVIIHTIYNSISIILLKYSSNSAFNWFLNIDLIPLIILGVISVAIIVICFMIMVKNKDLNLDYKYKQFSGGVSIGCIIGWIICIIMMFIMILPNSNVVNN